MLVKYSPAGGEAKVLNLEADDFELDEITEIEGLAGKPFMGLMQELAEGSMGRIKPLLFVLLKRDQPALDYAAFKVKLGEVKPVASRSELIALRKKVAAKPSAWPAGTLDALDAEIAAAAEAPAGKGDAPAPDSANSTPPVPSPRSGRSTRKR